MKIYKVLPFLIILTACDPVSKVKLKTPDPIDPKLRSLNYEGPSGVVSFELITTDGQAQLPAQINVVFEKPNSTNSNLTVKSLSPLYINMLYSQTEREISFGCPDSETNVLPLNIDAQKVVLCGNLKIPFGEFSLRTDNLELHSVSLSTETEAQDPTEVADISIFVNHLNLNDQSTIDLSGLSTPTGRNSAPPLFVFMNKLSGSGALEIVSRKLFGTSFQN